MPWRCPACHEQIRHSEFEEKPRLGALYRCHICRLELQLDPATERLKPRPLDMPLDDARDRMTGPSRQKRE
jgi:hypothetical protein